jgi:hypothetical protein
VRTERGIYIGWNRLYDHTAQRLQATALFQPTETRASLWARQKEISFSGLPLQMLNSVLRPTFV